MKLLQNENDFLTKKQKILNQKMEILQKQNDRLKQILRDQYHHHF